MDTGLFMDVGGWVGAMALLVAYALAALQKVPVTSRVYQLLNIVGSVLLGINTVYHGAFPSAFVNVIWVAIALVAFVRVRQPVPTA